MNKFAQRPDNIQWRPYLGLTSLNLATEKVDFGVTNVDLSWLG